MILEKLLQLEENLNSINASVLKYLRPPATYSEFEELINNYYKNVFLPHEIFALFKWHIGTSLNNELPAAN
jgi:hypothetical protein